jgi:hypothetical protein
MGVLTAQEWRGIWIAAPAATERLLLRRGFDVDAGLRRAVVHVSGLGQYELTLNGSKVGQDLLTPGWTNYNRTAIYDTYDVTASLHEGRNAAGIFLGNGMYHVVRRNRFAKFTGSFGPLRAILHLRLEYGDGRTDLVGTDETWRVHAGPITYSSIYGGEDYDARLEPRGWDTPGFDDGAWARAVPVVRLEDALRGHSAGSEPIRAIETRHPAGVRTFPANTSATVRVPSRNGSAVTEGGAAAVSRPGVAFVGLDGDGAVYRVESGRYVFGSRW